MPSLNEVNEYHMRSTKQVPVKVSRILVNT
jgi:hypothetical protein